MKETLTLLRIRASLLGVHRVPLLRVVPPTKSNVVAAVLAKVVDVDDPITTNATCMELPEPDLSPEGRWAAMDQFGRFGNGQVAVDRHSGSIRASAYTASQLMCKGATGHGVEPPYSGAPVARSRSAGEVSHA